MTSEGTVDHKLICIGNICLVFYADISQSLELAAKGTAQGLLPGTVRGARCLLAQWAPEGTVQQTGMWPGSPMTHSRL